MAATRKYDSAKELFQAITLNGFQKQPNWLLKKFRNVPKKITKNEH
jgi:hypothetical protein